LAQLSVANQKHVVSYFEQVMAWTKGKSRLIVSFFSDGVRLNFFSLTSRATMASAAASVSSSLSSSSSILAADGAAAQLSIAAATQALHACQQDILARAQALLDGSNALAETGERLLVSNANARAHRLETLNALGNNSSLKQWLLRATLDFVRQNELVLQQQMQHSLPAARDALLLAQKKHVQLQQQQQQAASQCSSTSSNSATLALLSSVLTVVATHVIGAFLSDEDMVCWARTSARSVQQLQRYMFKKRVPLERAVCLVSPWLPVAARSESVVGSSPPVWLSPAHVLLPVRSRRAFGLPASVSVDPVRDVQLLLTDSVLSGLRELHLGELSRAPHIVSALRVLPLELPASLTSLSVREAAVLRCFRLPPNLQTLQVWGSASGDYSLDGLIPLPPQLRSLHIMHAITSSLRDLQPQLPVSLTELRLPCFSRPIEEWPLPLPPHLRILQCAAISPWNDLQPHLPPSLTEIYSGGQLWQQGHN
jgi:hypothetical protein